METKENKDLILKSFIIGGRLTFFGFLLNSLTLVLTTCGLAATFLSLLIWIIDVKGYKKWSRLFESFSVNPLFIYVLAEILSTILSKIPISYANSTFSIKQYFCVFLLQPDFGDYLASLVFVVLFAILNQVIRSILYKKKTILKFNVIPIAY